MGSLQSVNNEDFKEQVLESKVPVVVDMYAPWCGPCKMVAPILEKLQEEYGDKVKFVQVNIDDNTELAAENQVQSIPNIIVFKNGKEIDRQIGASTEQSFKNIIENSL